MNQESKDPTKVMFDRLAKLYQQGQLLLMDADRLMGERGWEAMSNVATAGLSNSLNSPGRWYARWAVRFYIPAGIDKEKEEISRILFISVHFAQDHDTRLDEPVVSAGRLMYGDPMTLKVADRSYDYWVCKYYWFSKPHDTLEGWRQGGQSRFFKNLKASETFAVPLYDITSSDRLKEKVIDPLLAVQKQEESIA